MYIEDKAMQLPPCFLNSACSLNYILQNIPPCLLNLACSLNRDLRVLQLPRRPQ